MNIVYEDDAVLIIDKQAGVTTIPSLYHSNDSIANGILAHYEKYHIPYTVHIVTRLDRDTSGLLLVAKHRYSHSLLAASQKARKINRTYTALTEGILTKKIGTIDAKIGRKADSIIERTVCLDGQQAITHYEVLEEKEQLSVVRVSLETGRTHQIRVHFSWLGHPLIGDDLYGGSQALLNRQALHCSQLSFIHPFTNREMVFHSTLPKDMQRLIQNQ
ncbi:RluA family pseudouridine synthase [Virgibacillus soli]|uniref:Pseudouridine synthase n=1 Tax=Paracerasibacillus soli TaxID=480284 RepID=A0ABU5CNH2_9BACI|nr:RluA family pseudouridine synthase [Virgibacillus soli]MDY0407916.1 RluA family pseudouridine synthase [Virgibacillus soli]